MRIESFDVNAFALFFFFSFPAEARESEAGEWKEWGGGEFSTLQDSTSRSK